VEEVTTEVLSLIKAWVPVFTVVGGTI